jgi:hypothetical protein
MKGICSIAVVSSIMKRFVDSNTSLTPHCYEEIPMNVILHCIVLLYQLTKTLLDSVELAGMLILCTVGCTQLSTVMYVCS